MNRLRLLAAATAALLLTGCYATTSLTAAQSGTTVVVKSTRSADLPRTETMTATSFGNYMFRAESPGFEPFTGNLPLKFNGGYLAADILFFAPALFFNLREPFRYYEFDLEKRVVKYRKNESENWTVYTPSPAEAGNAAKYLETHSGQ